MSSIVSLLALLFIGWFVWVYVTNAMTHLEPRSAAVMITLLVIALILMALGWWPTD